MSIEEKLKNLSKPLKIGDIDFRIQSINNGGYATILAYKNARVDMQRLDEAVGALNWKREHTRDNHNCIVSIWDEEKKQWVSKEDTGTESLSEKEKGLASDSFKRACFNWGIGRELYSYPFISIKLDASELVETGSKPKFKASYNLKIRDWNWNTYFENGKLMTIEAIDTKGKTRYKYPSKQNIKIDPDKEKLKQAKTVDELKKQYQSLSKEKQTLLSQLTTKLKLELEIKNK